MTLREGRALARWATRRQYLAAAAALTAILCLYFWPLFTGDQLGQNHVLYYDYPWKAYRPSTTVPQPSGAGDPVYAFHPLASVVREQVRDGDLPLWNPYSYAGMTLLGDMQTAVLHPLTWLGWLLPLEDAWGLMAALKLLTAGLGAFALARLLGVSFPGALLAGAVYMLSAPSIVWLQYPLGAAMATFPWLLWATHRLYPRPTSRSVATLGAVAALSILAGHPETAVLSSSAAAVYLIALMALDRGRIGALADGVRSFGAWLGAHALALGVSAAVTIPFLQALDDSVTTDVHRDELAAFRLPSLSVLTYALPDLFGDGRPDYFRLDSTYILTAGYVGVTVVLLAAVGIGRNRRSAPATALAATAVVALMAAYGVPPIRMVLENVPPYAWGITSRTLFIVAAAAAVLAGVGLDSLLRRPLAVRAVLILVAGAATLVCGLLVVGVLADELPAPGRVEREALLRFTLALGVAGLCLLAVGRARRAVVVALVVGVIALDLAYLQGFNAMLPKEEAYPGRTPALAFLQRQPEPFRLSPIAILSQQGVLSPNTSAPYGLESIQGYDFPLSQRWANFSAGVLKEVGDIPEHALISPTVRGASLEGLRMMNVRYYVTAPDRRRPHPSFRAVYRGRDATIFRDPEALPRAYVVSHVRRAADDRALDALVRGTLDARREALVPPRAGAEAAASTAAPNYREAKVESPTADHVRVRVPAGEAGWLVLANAFSPQWEATVDGRSVELSATNYAAMGIPVPAGAHVADFRYDRSGFWTGCAVSAAALLLLGLLGLDAPRRLSRTVRGGDAHAS